MLSQGEPCDAAVNFDTYQILQWHRAVSLPLHDFLVYFSDHSHAKITHSTRIFMAMMQSRKSESAQFGQILGLSSPTISLPTASLTNWIQYYKQQICLMSSVYSMSICLSVTLCIVAKRYIPQQVSEQVSRKCPLETRFHKFQPLYQPYPLKLPPPKFRNLSYLLCLAFLIMWPFCLCCYNIGKYWYQGDH